MQNTNPDAINETNTLLIVSTIGTQCLLQHPCFTIQAYNKVTAAKRFPVMKSCTNADIILGFNQYITTVIQLLPTASVNRHNITQPVHMINIVHLKKASA